MYAAADPPEEANQDDEDDEVDEDEEEHESDDSEAETGRNTPSVPNQVQNVVASVEPSELMQLEMSEDIRLGSPDDGSNNLESDFHLIGSGNRADSFRVESARRWTMMQDPLEGSLQPAFAGKELVLVWAVFESLF